MKSFKLGLLSILICCITEGFAQFQTASVNDPGFSVTANGRAAGNDILDDGTDVYEVSVWEDVGGASGFGFVFNGGTPTPVSIITYTDAVDPDVCLSVDANGDVHALVAYYSPVQDYYYIEDFIWSGATFAPNSIIQIDNQTSFGTAVNIDCDYDGYFVIVWDVGGNIFARAGDVSSGTLGAIAGIGSAGGNGTYPDVCIYDRSSNRVTYCYLDGGNLIVDSDTYGGILTASSAANNELNASPTNYNWLWPRIACPNPSIGSSNDWSVVAQETNGTSDWDIIGYNYDNSLGVPLTGPNNLNDGGWMSVPEDLSSVDNSMPVVTYLDQSNEIYVGWTLTNNSGFLTNPIAAIYPVMI